jgi:hypothetical protein
MTALKGQEENIHAMHFFSWSVEHWEEFQGQIQDFKLRGGAHLKKSRRAKIFGVFRVKNHDFTTKIIFFPIAEGGAKNFSVFRVKNHDFTTKNHIFSNCGGRRENFWGISCEKSRFNAKKSYFFQF